MAKKKEKLQRARVLGGFTLDGIEYKPNDIIESDPRLIESLSGSVDSDDEAVAYCINEFGAVIRQHSYPEQAASTGTGGEQSSDDDRDGDPDTGTNDANTQTDTERAPA